MVQSMRASGEQPGGPLEGQRRLRVTRAGCGRHVTVNAAAMRRTGEPPPPPPVRPGSWAAWASARALLRRHVRRRSSPGPPPARLQAPKTPMDKCQCVCVWDTQGGDLHVRRRISLDPSPGAEEAAKTSTEKDPAREAAGLISTRRRRAIAWANGPPGALGRGRGAGPCGAVGQTAWPHAWGLNYAGDTGPVAQRDARI
jgi:hypothetical protein